MAQRDARQSSLDQPAYGMWVIVAGLAALVAVTVVAVVRYDKATDVVTLLGAVTGVIAALVGAYFGVRGATLAQQKAAESIAPPGRVTAQAAGGDQQPAVVPGPDTVSPGTTAGGKGVPFPEG